MVRGLPLISMVVAGVMAMTAPAWSQQSPITPAERPAEPTAIPLGTGGVIEAWQAAGRPVEFHLYQNGGHGFGLGNPGKTSLGWFDVFMRWIELNGWLQAGT